MTAVSWGTLGADRLGGPNGLGDLVVPELLRGPPCGRCGIQKDRGGGLSGRISLPCAGGSVHWELGVSVEKGL
jgi:hypothetical protein